MLERLWLSDNYTVEVNTFLLKSLLPFFSFLIPELVFMILVNYQTKTHPAYNQVANSTKKDAFLPFTGEIMEKALPYLGGGGLVIFWFSRLSFLMIFLAAIVQTFYIV